MKIQTFSYRYAQEILEHPNYAEAFDELMEICRNCPLPVYKDKSKTQPRLDVVQQIINTYFKISFTQKGWEPEPMVTPSEFDDSLRGDFRKQFTKMDLLNASAYDISLQIEVEMGNIASSYRNYFKFQLSYAHKLADIAVLILPCDELSRRIDSGVASFEKTVREIPSADLSITVPILVIGLDDTNVEAVDIESIEKDLRVVKGSQKAYEEEHRSLVEKIINTS